MLVSYSHPNDETTIVIVIRTEAVKERGIIAGRSSGSGKLCILSSPEYFTVCGESQSPRSEQNRTAGTGRMVVTRVPTNQYK